MRLTGAKCQRSRACESIFSRSETPRRSGIPNKSALLLTFEAAEVDPSWRNPSPAIYLLIAAVPHIGYGNFQREERDGSLSGGGARLQVGQPVTTARQIGIAGLGLLGSALAHRLLTNGFSPKGYDIDAAKVAAFAKAGGTAAPLEGVARCDVVLLAVFDTSQVEDVVENAVLPALTPGVPKIVLCASTCDPDRIAALVAKIAPLGLSMIETPVSGSSGQVRNGDGVGLTGGDRDIIDGVADIIDAIYPKWFYMGPAGNGGRAKLAINHLLGLNRLVLAEGLVFAERLGLDPRSFLDVAKQSAAYSQVMDIKGPKMVSGDYTPQGFIHQSLKDFRLILEQAGKRGQDMPLALLNAEVLAACVNNGEAERDNSAVIEEIRRRKT